ncbi:MAG: hypothetical protein IKX89_00900, partial [Firmicutes bacterium]|nr:hypothetical protein [Bacillota bacterium]
MQQSSVYTFIIDAEHGGERADKVLSLLMEDCSRSFIQKIIEGGGLIVDGAPLLSKRKPLK